MTGPANGTRAIFEFTLKMNRTDLNGLVPLLFVATALKRVDLNNSNPATNTFFSPAQIVILGAAGTPQTVSLNLEEDGTYATTFPANHTYSMSAVGFVNLPANAYDNDLLDNEIAWGTFKSQGPLTGDIKIDGRVDILDAISLALVYGMDQSNPNWKATNDLKADGTINVLDFIVLGLNFAKTAPGPQFP
jgi:hypothetical protein